MKKLTAICLAGFMCFAFLAGCKAPSVNVQEIQDNDNKNKDKAANGAMGRYIEEPIAIPEYEGVIYSAYLESGNIVLYSMQTIDQKLKVMRQYSSDGGATWQSEEFKEASALFANGENAGNFSEICKGGDGNSYGLLLTYEDIGNSTTAKSQVVKNTDGKMEIIEPKGWSEKQQDGRYKIYPNCIHINDKGEIFADDYKTGLINQYSPDGKTLIRSYESDNKANQIDFAIGKGKLAIIDNTKSEIIIYDTETGDKQSSVSFQKAGNSMNIIFDEENALYFINQKGIHRIAEGGSMVETIIDGELCSLNMPSLNVTHVDKSKDEFIILYYDNVTQKNKIMKYTYSSDTPTVPETEISVYSLYDNAYMRQAIGEYQRSNPNVKISLKTGINEGDTSVTTEDLIRTLNTQILAENGPDIFLLNELPIKEYIQKGILMDISDIISPMLDSQELMSNIIMPFKTDDKFYSVPMNYYLPAVAADNEAAKGVDSLSELCQKVEQYQKDGKQFFNIIGVNSMENWFDYLYFAAVPAIIKEGKIDEESLSSYLSSIKIIKDGSEGQMMDNFNGLLKKYAVEGMPINELNKAAEFESLMSFAYKDCDMICWKIEGLDSLMNINGARVQRGNSKLALMPAMAEGVFIPNNQIGINAATKNENICKEFVKLMLSKEVQQVDVDLGFPVNHKALEAQMEVVKSIATGFSSSENDRTLNSEWPSKEDRLSVKALCEKLKTPSIIDKNLQEIIKKGAKNFFEGTASADEAAKQAAQNASTYLAQ